MTRARVPQKETSSLVAQLNWSGGLQALAVRAPSLTQVDGDLLEAILEAAADLAADQLEDAAIAAERSPPELSEGSVRVVPQHHTAWNDYAVNGWLTLDLPVSRGGQGLPLAVAVSAQEIFDRHAAAFGMLPVPIRSAMRLIEAFAPEPLRDEWLPRLATGRWAATICISEVDAGSDAARMRTRATRSGSTGWSVTGEKHWISFGSHDLTERIGHCLLAKTPDARGLSLFLVPDKVEGSPNGVSVRGIERKLGLHASPTCSIGFEGSVAYLLGEEGQGLQQMFVMIGNMRLAVAAMGLGMASAAADVALAYARERRQGGGTERPLAIIEHADVARMLCAMQADVEVARRLIYSAAVETDLGRSDVDEVRRAASNALAQWLLPLVKTLGGELACSTSAMAMQVLGGAGYTTDWPVEQLLRDARVLPIFEGTTGMQGLDLLHRRLGRDRGAGLQVFRERFAAAIGKLELAGEIQLARAVGAVDVLLAEAADGLSSMMAVPRDAEAGADAFLHLAIHAALGWAAAELAAGPANGTTADRLRSLGRYWLQGFEEKARVFATETKAGSRRLDPTCLC